MLDEISRECIPHTDFTLGQTAVIFQPTDTRQCVPLGITEDNILEDDETFTLTLESQQNSVVVLNSNTARVVIENDDSELAIVVVHLIHPY